MHNTVNRKVVRAMMGQAALAAAAGATVLRFDSAGHQALGASPTMVYTAANVQGFDNTAFTSLTLGLEPNGSSAASNLSPSPNSIVNFDGSLLVGYDFDTNSASGQSYSELYTVNITNLSTSVITLNDSNHTVVDSVNDTYNPSLLGVSSSGTILGEQGSYNPNGPSPTGNDLFTSSNEVSPSVLPIPASVLGGGASYTYTLSGAPYQYEGDYPPADTYSGFNTLSIGTGGIVLGSVQRVAGDSYTPNPGQILGYDGFYYNPSTGTSAAIGLSGGRYDYAMNSGTSQTLLQRQTSVTGMAGTAAAGYTQLFNASGGRAGYDGWIYTPTLGTVQIGLVGGQYTLNSNGVEYENTQTYRTNSIGQIAGKSNYIIGTGDPVTADPTADAWLYTPSATPGTASGLGSSSAGTYAQLGLTTPTTSGNVGYTNPAAGATSPIHYTNIAFLDNTGHAAGQSSRYDSSGNYQGFGAWYYNGSTNVDISPNALSTSDTIHAAVSGGAISSTNYVTAINNTGMAAGYATRISGTTSSSTTLGQDAYVYDSNSAKEYFVDPTDEASPSNYEFSYVGTLSDIGYAVGFYNTYSASNAQQTSTIFVWSELGKLQPLYSFTNKGFTASNTLLENYVSNFQFGSDGELYGPNTYSHAASIVAYGLNVIWNNSLGSGNGQTWDTTSQNWTNGVIPLVYLPSAMVTFNDNNNGHYDVTVNSAVSPNAVTFNNSVGNYALSGSGGIAGAGGLTKLGADSVTLATTDTYTGATNVSGGSLVLAAAGALPTGTNLTIGSGASVVADNLGTRYGLTVGSLGVSGKLDLNRNALVVHNSSIGAVTSFLKSGYHSGIWNGASGIVSTTAAADTSHLTALGVIINDTGANTGSSTGTPIYSTLAGASTTDGDVLVKYTYYGDANLSGAVDGTDYSLIDNGYLNHLTGWFNGDFNYDGVVDGSDYTLIDNAFNAQGASLNALIAGPEALPTDQLAGSASVSAVPEPGAGGIIASVLIGILARRRRIRV